jgi:hypothetical protein
MWGNAQVKVEYLNSPKKDLFDNYANYCVLSEYPIQSIVEFKRLNSDGTVAKTYPTLTSVQIAAGTYDTTDYWLETMVEPLTNAVIPYGKITLKSDVFPTGTKNIKISYTYGWTAVPTQIKTLATCLAGIRAWIYFLGGNYNRLDSYNIPQQSVTKGNFYERGKQNIEQLREEADRLLDRIGRRQRVLFFGSSGGT